MGGCSRSGLWRQIFADTLEMNILKTNVGQEAGSLGAAAVALVARGVWPDFNPIDNLHQLEAVAHPQEASVHIYRQLLPLFHQARLTQSQLGDALAALTFRPRPTATAMTNLPSPKA